MQDKARKKNVDLSFATYKFRIYSGIRPYSSFNHFNTVIEIELKEKESMTLNYLQKRTTSEPCLENRLRFTK